MNETSDEAAFRRYGVRRIVERLLMFGSGMFVVGLTFYFYTVLTR